MQVLRYFQIVFTGIVLYLYITLMYVYRAIEVPLNNKLAVMQLESSDFSYMIADLFINKMRVSTFLTISLVFLIGLVWVPSFFIKRDKKEYKE